MLCKKDIENSEKREIKKSNKIEIEDIGKSKQGKLKDEMIDKQHRERDIMRKESDNIDKI